MAHLPNGGIFSEKPLHSFHVSLLHNLKIESRSGDISFHLKMRYLQKHLLSKK